MSPVPEKLMGSAIAGNNLVARELHQRSSPFFFTSLPWTGYHAEFFSLPACKPCT